MKQLDEMLTRIRRAIAEERNPSNAYNPGECLYDVIDEIEALEQLVRELTQG